MCMFRKKKVRYCMRKAEIIACICALSLIFAGCRNGIDYSLSDNPIAFETGTYENPYDVEDTYLSIEYNGRIYIGYGTIKGTIAAEDVGNCLGFIVQDNVRYEDSRIFLLTDDPDSNYLGRFETEGVMNQPDFFRAIDTVGQDIYTPDYIEDLGYDFWKNDSLPGPSEHSDIDLFYANEVTADYTDIRALDEKYSADQALMDNCFVVGAMVHNENLYYEFMEKSKDNEDAFVRVVQTTTEGDAIIYDVLYVGGTDKNDEEVQIVVDTTRDKFAGEDNRDITLTHYDGTMEYEEDGHKYWVAYNGNPDNVKLDDGKTFVIVVIY